MEQAANQFAKGLQLDTHPMVQGNDTMSDCLNGTFVTMNGDEVILQNDMGNKRIDNAFLPAGYEPVGIKEYGGIIYLALYNPITNKSQLGSFPSPERIINGRNKDSLLIDFIPPVKNTEKGIKFLKSNYILSPLSQDNLLRAGDKFTLYWSEITNNNVINIINNLSNYNNITDNKVTSPKNKKYTLRVGILNSQNEFVDITDNLIRWNTNTSEKIEVFDKTDLYKQNVGYFVQSSYNSDEDFIKPTKDKQLIEQRQALPINTYSYKLVGQLYIKQVFNTIQYFNYNIYAIKNVNGNNDSVEFTITADITYNCPDGITAGGRSDDNYYSYAESKIDSSEREEVGQCNLNGFELYNANSNTYEKISQSGSTQYSKVRYNSQNNLYTLTVTKTYSLRPDVYFSDNDTFNYFIGVDSGFKENNIENGNILLLEEFSEKGSISLNDIESGGLNLEYWRYYVYDSSTFDITYRFKCYPEYGHSFGNVSLKFQKVTVNNEQNSEWIQFDNVQKTLNNGRYTFTLNDSEDELHQGFMYRVQIVVTETGPDNYNQTYTFKRFLLNSKLFNKYYNPISTSFISDFKDIGTENVELECDVQTEISNKNVSVETQGSPVIVSETSPGLMTYYIKQTQEFDTIPNLDISIKNRDLYPDYIGISNILYSTDNTYTTPTNLFEKVTWHNWEDHQWSATDMFSVNNQNQHWTIINWDRLQGNSEERQKTFENVFIPIGDAFENEINKVTKYSGELLYWEDEGDHRYVYVILNSDTKDGNQFYRVTTNEDAFKIAHRDGDHSTYRIFEMNSRNYSESGNIIMSDIFYRFNYLTTSLTYIYYSFDDYSKIVYFSNSTNMPSERSVPNSTEYARLWWRGSNLEDWVLIELPNNYGLLHKNYESSTLKLNIGSCLFNNYHNEAIYVCYHKYIDKLCYTATSNQKYNNYYDLTENITFKYYNNGTNIIDNGYDSVNYYIPQFIIDSDYVFGTNVINLSVKSNEDLFSQIDDGFNQLNSNVIIAGNNILWKDKDDNGLQRNKLYKYSNNKLIPLSNNPIKLYDQDNSDYTLLCSSYTNKTPTYKYEYCGQRDEGTKTRLDYVNVPMVVKVDMI